MNGRRSAEGFTTSGCAAGASVPPSGPAAGPASAESGAESGRRRDGAWPDRSASRNERNGLLKYGLTMEIPPVHR